jgi:hypothetical protein
LLHFLRFDWTGTSGAVVDGQRSGAIGNQQKYLKQRPKRPVEGAGDHFLEGGQTARLARYQSHANDDFRP